MKHIGVKICIGIVSLLLLLGGCDRKQEDKLAIIPENETIAVVNNKKISLDKFQNRLQHFLRQYRHIITDERAMNEIKEIVINQLIMDELIQQEAARRGILVSEEELDTQVNDALNPYEGAEFRTYLEEANLTEDAWKEALRLQLLQRKLIRKEVIDKIPVTKREIQSFARKNKREVIHERAYRVRNITLSTKEEAEAILLQLERGKSFVSLVREHSISPDKVVDGDLGFIELSDMPPEFESAISNLGVMGNRKPLSPIVHSHDGFHIFKFIQYRPLTRLGVMSQREAKNKIKEIFIAERQVETYQKWLTQLHQRSTITIDKVLLASEEGF